jgi:DNA-binding NarL/FixJ family response regulator
MTAARARAAFVGRVEELDRLRAASSRAMAGGSSAVLCFGEAGIGKSRLVAEFTARAAGDGVAVLEGGCVELGSAGLPYGPFAEVLRTALRDGLLDPEALHADTRTQLAMLVPELGARTRRSTSARRSTDGRPELGQVPLFEAVLAAFASASRQQGLIVVLEDVHWADRSTMDLLAFLVRNLEAVPLLLVITIRTDGLDRRDPLAVLVTELTRRPGVERLDLAPLDLAATRRQLESILGYEPDGAMARRIHQRSDGNPFFVEQLARSYLDGEPVALPPSLRDLLLSQLSQLPADVQRLAAAVAIAGPHADERLLAAMVDASEREVLERLRVAVDQHVLVPVHGSPHDGYAFHHALLAEAAESDLLDGERRDLHARCADAVARERPGDGADLARWAGRIAHHRERADQRLLTIAASIEAAQAAEAVAAHGDAFAQYLRATRLLRPDENVPVDDWDRSRLFGRAGVSAAHAGDPEAAARLTRLAIDELSADADAFERGRLLVRYAEYQWTSSDDGFVATLKQAAEVIPAVPPTALRADALNALGFHHQYLGEHRAAIAAFDEARATALSVLDAGNELAIADSCLAFYAYEDGDVVRGDAAIVEGRDALRQPSANGRASAGWMDLVGVVGWSGNDPWAVELAEEGLRRIRAAGAEAYYGGVIAANGAECLLSMGRLGDGLAMLATVHNHASGGYLDSVFLLTRALLQTAVGDLAAATQDLEAISDRASHGDQSIARMLAYVSAEVRVERGDIAGVRDAVDGALALPPTHIPLVHEVGLMAWLAIRAEADAAERSRARRDVRGVTIGSDRSATVLAAAEQHLASAAPRSPATGRGRAFLALARAEECRRMGTSDPAAWRVAVDAWSGRRLVLRPLYARIREAEALLAGSRTSRAAADRLVDAYAEARRLGAGRLAEMAAAIARRARVDLAAVEGTGTAVDGRGKADADDAGTSATTAVRAYGLTNREVEILSLLAAGLTNRQIGEQLYISPKTAGVHVSNLLGKLGVSGRVQAATLAHHLGVEAPTDFDAVSL